MRRWLAPALLLACSSAPVRAQQVMRFDVPSGPLARCIELLGTQGHATIAGDATLLAGARCKAVSGQMSVAEALSRALAGSKLAFLAIRPNLFRIVAKAAPVQVPVPPPLPPPRPVAEPVWPEIVVVAQSPMLWRIRKGDAELVILGTVAPIPVGQTWSTLRLRRLLHGARRLILAPEPRSGLVWMDNWRSSDGAGLMQPVGQFLEPGLPEALRARFAATRQQIGQPVTRYAGLKPAVAGILLLEDWRRQDGLVTREPGGTVEALARKEHVPILRIDPASTLPTLDALPQMPMPAQEACLVSLLANVEAESERAAQQATAWAAGDVAALKHAYVPPATCAAELPGDRQRRERARLAWLAALDGALSAPGRVMAVADVTALLMPGGLLDHLRDMGAEIAVIDPVDLPRQ